MSNEVITAEQLKKFSECTSTNEVIKLASEEGIALTDEQIDSVSGGGWGDPATNCKYCGSTWSVGARLVTGPSGKNGVVYTCRKCGKSWEDSSATPA